MQGRGKHGRNVLRPWQRGAVPTRRGDYDMFKTAGLACRDEPAVRGAPFVRAAARPRAGAGGGAGVLAVFGLSVFAALFFGMLWRTACRWRYLATFYATEPGRPIEARRFQNGVLLGLGGFNTLKGILKLGVHETGLSLRLMAPFSLFHPPLFIPYKDIEGWVTTWYLDAKSTELWFRRAPDVKIVMPAQQAEWIGGFAGGKIVLHDVRPPQGNAGRGWRIFIIVVLCYMLFMIGILLFELFTA